MLETRRPELSIDQLMQRIRDELGRSKASQSRPSTAATETAHAPGGATELCSSESITAPPPLTLQLPAPKSLEVQPVFRTDKDSLHHVDDLMAYHDKTFIFAAYRTLLRRDPDKSGFHHYLNDLRKGISKIEILGNIRNSAEGRAANVRIAGLTIPYAIEAACHWPVFGSIIRFAHAAWNLPQLLRRQRKIENQLFEFAELANQHTFAELRVIHDALEKIEQSGNQLLSHSSTRASLQALLAIQASVANIQAGLKDIHAKTTSKADKASLDEVRRLMESALETKASRQDLSIATDRLASQIAERPSPEDIKSLAIALNALSDTVELFSLRKADRADLKSAERIIQMRFGEDLDRLNQTVQALAHTKADHAAIEKARADAQAMLRAAQEDLDRIILSVAQTKVDHSALASLQAETNDRLQSTFAALSGTMQSLAQTKADRSALESVQAEAKAALQATLESLNSALRSLDQTKADRSALESARIEAGTTLQSAVESLNTALESLAQTKADSSTIAVAQAETKSALESIHRNAMGTLNAALEPLAAQTQKLKHGLLDQERRLGALLKEARKRLPKPISTSQVEAMLVEERNLLDSMYASFEDQFRGTREDIKQRQQVYLTYVRNIAAGAAKGPVIDLGCGRGEWLELLRDERIPARGVDLNRVFLGTCRHLKLNVTERDAIEFLRSLKPNSARAVTAFHLIEHLPFDALVALFDEALRVLRPGGIVIFETPNPRNMIVGSCTFYLDPTHRNPLPPELPRYLLEARGFGNVTIKELHPFPKESLVTDGAPQINQILNQHFFGPQDYAVIATKG